MLMKPCYRCKLPVPYPTTYCDGCKDTVVVERSEVSSKRAEQQGEVKRQANRRYNAKRDPRYIKFYQSPAWRMLSERYRQDKQYKCERCNNVGTDVHHKLAIQTDEGWSKQLDYDNLELLCVRCHNKEHNRFTSNKK